MCSLCFAVCPRTDPNVGTCRMETLVLPSVLSCRIVLAFCHFGLRLGPKVASRLRCGRFAFALGLFALRLVSGRFARPRPDPKVVPRAPQDGSRLVSRSRRSARVLAPCRWRHPSFLLSSVDSMFRPLRVPSARAGSFFFVNTQNFLLSFNFF